MLCAEAFVVHLEYTQCDLVFRIVVILLVKLNHYVTTVKYPSTRWDRAHKGAQRVLGLKPEVFEHRLGCLKEGHGRQDVVVLRTPFTLGLSLRYLRIKLALACRTAPVIQTQSADNYSAPSAELLHFVAFVSLLV